ncbi:PLP-dependent transferase [Laetiporus sulphureus 93-53]|uniref:PLP-dependent transferase n=1 Tax=Laetiporus sulphureus 93-53 TaxID=1314785 RepID=A0A165BRS9_9APHY|nr:PLP-dependent transferase [Laetiporus sulphureus 93-53]KZT01535.1 PLP-dependent transferase [Laetiporus sulphureus 93-53]
MTHLNGPSARDGTHKSDPFSKVPLNVLPPEFYAARLSKAARSRREDGIRALLPLESRPGLISLLAGKPNAETFPITSLQFTMRDPTRPGGDVKMELTEEELNRGMQYGPTSGFHDLREWMFGLQEYLHARGKGEGWGVSVGAGSQDLLFKAATALLDPGDAMFVETPVYAGVLPIFHALECDMIESADKLTFAEVHTDAQGICSHSLRTMLESWPASKPKPKVLYTIPYGSNPTGVTATVERRKEVLALSREHDFLILEDDPYYNLYYGAASRPPSYFSLEKSEPEVGRVLRFDSLSKILSSGIRIGFATGPEPILKAMEVHSMMVNLQPSSFSQVLAHKVLSSWGYAGFSAHTARVAEFYRAKRDVFEAAMQRHLAGLAEWCTPEAGMFFWFKLLLSEPGAGQDVEDDSEDLIRTIALKRGVLALPGTTFYPSGRRTAYVRASFSLLPAEEVDEALRRLRRVVLDARKALAKGSK